jgi:hypothetical protein
MWLSPDESQPEAFPGAGPDIQDGSNPVDHSRRFKAIPFSELPSDVQAEAEARLIEVLAVLGTDAPRAEIRHALRGLDRLLGPKCQHLEANSSFDE